MLIISSPRFAQHRTPPGHPECSERAHVFDIVSSSLAARGHRVVEPRPASTAELARAHRPEYIEMLAATAGRPAMLDADTFTSPDSYATALLAAGAAIDAAAYALETGDVGVALVRPPGHHAGRSSAAGFCLYNNVSVAAAALVARGLERVAIVDIDVHHGNGTEEIFIGERRVLYVSSHQFPFYPGTGDVDRIGEGDGRGFNVNIPVEAGANDADMIQIYETVVDPILQRFNPEVLLVSAGFDAHEADPLASLRMTSEGFVRLFRLLADANASGRMALVTEGGYDLEALGASLLASLECLAGERTAPVAPDSRPTGRGERSAREVWQTQAPWWGHGGRPGNCL
jgi:acetoin utilization deacetylase AcuC-like enzyme